MSLRGAQRGWSAGLVLGVLVLGGGLWTAPDAMATGQIAERTIRLVPQDTFVKASFLTGELRGLRVVEQLDRPAGELIGPPMLRATLTLTNDSMDQAALLLGGTIEYLDPSGKRIPAEGTRFVFVGARSNRLDPGMRLSQAIEVPFPPEALKRGGLRDVELILSYLPGPYRVDAVSVPVSLGERAAALPDGERRLGAAVTSPPEAPQGQAIR